MCIVPAKLLEFKGVVPRELIGAMCWPNFWGEGVCGTAIVKFQNKVSISLSLTLMFDLCFDHHVVVELNSVPFQFKFHTF